jgi:hypothetical protein
MNFSQTNLDKLYYILQKRDMKNLIYCWKEIELVIKNVAHLLKEIFLTDLSLLEEKEVDFKPILEILNST